jgi:transcriptional regulator with XRE-family HTH domain
MASEAALSKKFELKAKNGEIPPYDGHARPPAVAKQRSWRRSKLAAALKTYRSNLGLTQQSLAQKLGVRASHIALLENGSRRPSLALIARLASTLGADGRQLLELAYPEVRALVAPIPTKRTKLSQSWERLFKNTTLLARYRVTRHELEVLEHLAALGGKMTAKRLLAILLLARDIP